MPDTDRIKGFLWDEFKKWFTRGIFLFASAFLIAIFTPYASNVQDIWQSPQRLDSIEIGIQTLNESIRSLSGENRIIRQREGLSYVEEPVSQGQNVFLYLVIERTELGKNCELTKATPLFKDRTGVTNPGTRPDRPYTDGLSTETTAVRLEYIPPPNLTPGRVEVYVAFEYDCGEEHKFDRTSILSYQLLPGA